LNQAVSCCIPVPAGASDFAAVAEQAASAPGVPFDSSDQPQLDAQGLPKKEDAVKQSEEVEQILSRLLDQRQQVVKAMRFEPISFEKDDDTNFHMEFVSSLANLRARSYQIEEVDKFKAKITAGNIIPAIATSTAIAAGLVCLEFYKLLQGKKGEDFRSSNFNIGASIFQLFEPEFVKPFQHGALKWTQWDRWIIEDSDITLGGVLDFVKARGLNVDMLSIGTSSVYSSFNSSHAAKLKLKVADIAKGIADAVTEGKKFVDLLVLCSDDEDRGVNIPLVSVRIRS
jgi:ubiquitin-activating enzyme E1